MDKIIYKKPAVCLQEAMPVGNGRLGALVFGGTGNETIQLNEESLWNGSYKNRLNKSARKSIKDVRRLLELNRWDEAQELVVESFSGIPSGMRSYKNGPKVGIHFYNAENAGRSQPDKDDSTFADPIIYSRELDLEKGLCQTQFTVGNEYDNTADLSASQRGSTITYTREAFVSLDGDVLVYHITSSCPKTLFLKLGIEAPEGAVNQDYTFLGDDTLIYKNADGIPYSVVVSAVVSSGSVAVKGENIIVSQADEVTLYIDLKTAYSRHHYRSKKGLTYRNLLKHCSWCADESLQKVCFAFSTSYNNLKQNHVRHYEKYFGKTVFELGESAGEDGVFFKKYWDMCFYNTFASLNEKSRVFPMDGGLWYGNGKRYNARDLVLDMESCWIAGAKRSKKKLAVEKFLAHNAAVTAEKMYTTEGCCVHCSTDIWGDTYPAGKDLRYSYSPTGAVWFVRAACDRYEYTLDKKALKQGLDFAKKSADFFCTYLVSMQENKKLILKPAFGEFERKDGSKVYMAEYSLEETALLADLFENVLKMMDYLGDGRNSTDGIKYQIVLAKLKASLGDSGAAVKRPVFDMDAARSRSEQGEFSMKDLTLMVDCFAGNCVKDGKVYIKLLSAIPKGCESGSIKHLRLRGNLRLDLAWEKGKIKEAKLYTMPGTIFLQDVCIGYGERWYDSRLQNGTLDIFNVLPSTV